jgi:hypothetical protein
MYSFLNFIYKNKPGFTLIFIHESVFFENIPRSSKSEPYKFEPNNDIYFFKFLKIKIIGKYK